MPDFDIDLALAGELPVGPPRCSSCGEELCFSELQLDRHPPYLHAEFRCEEQHMPRWIPFRLSRAEQCNGKVLPEEGVHAVQNLRCPSCGSPPEGNSEYESADYEHGRVKVWRKCHCGFQWAECYVLDLGEDNYA